MNILTGLAAVTKIIKECVHVENVPDGLLEDVQSIINVANNEEGVDEPCIWIVQHPTVPEKSAKATISRTIDLSTTFEFVCIEYDPDPETAELKSQDLAARVVLSLMRNFQQIQSIYGGRVIKRSEFNMFYPVGEVAVQGKREKVPVTSVSINVLHRIDWLNCCKRKNDGINEENENNENNDNDGD